jgi:predicted nuclease of predicted toxin-antitoxin system
VRFKLDENMPRDALTLLRAAGHDVESALDEGLGGRPDDDVLRASVEEGRILITYDLDFSDIRTYPPSSTAGIWVLRPTSHAIEVTLRSLAAAISLLETETAEKRLWIVEPDRIRIRV